MISKTRGYPKMDGVSNGKPFFEMIWGENPLFFGNISIYLGSKKNPPLSTQPGTWILQNALKAFFFPPLRSSRRSSKQDQRSTDCNVLGGQVGGQSDRPHPGPWNFRWKPRWCGGSSAWVPWGTGFPEQNSSGWCTFFSRHLDEDGFV